MRTDELRFDTDEELKASTIKFLNSTKINAFSAGPADDGILIIEFDDQLWVTALKAACEVYLDLIDVYVSGPESKNVENFYSNALSKNLFGRSSTTHSINERTIFLVAAFTSCTNAQQFQVGPSVSQMGESLTYLGLCGLDNKEKFKLMRKILQK